MSVCQKFQTYNIDERTHSLAAGVHLDYISSPPPSPDDVFGNLLLGEYLAVILVNLPCPFLQKSAPSSSPIFSCCVFFSRWWPHKAHWKMSSGGVREAIWGLIDGSRRTTAAMFSDLPMCKPCLALSEKREKFFLKVNAAARHVAVDFSSYLCQCFRK